MAEPTKYISARISVELYDQVRDIARLTHTSITTMVRDGLQKAVAHLLDVGGADLVEMMESMRQYRAWAAETKERSTPQPADGETSPAPPSPPDRP